MASRRQLVALLGAGLWLVAAGPATAQDSGVAPAAPGPGAGSGAAARPPLLLNLMTRPTETPERAMQEAVREDARPRPAGSADVEVLPDGSVRIGRTRVGVTVKEACPEDPTHNLDLVPRPLPGRARR